jgi:hypothetical protein
MQEAALRERLEGMETHALLEMWCKQERLPWAEAVLRKLLLERGIADAQLEQGRVEAARIEAETVSGQSLAGFAVVGRFVAIFLAMAISNLVSSFGAPNLGMIAAMSIIAIYVALLIRYLVLASRKRKSDAVVAGMAFMWIEAVVLGCVALTGLISTFAIPMTAG